MNRTLLFVMLLASLPLEAGQSRVWHYTDGRTFTAEYQWSSPDTLYRRGKKGREFEVPLGALSNADLEYVRGLLSRDTSRGIVYHTPLTWEEFRSKKLTTSKAQERGYYPVDSLSTSEGSLRLQFRRFGPTPKVAANQQVVLRLITAPHGGTRSTIRVSYGGKMIGAVRGAPSGGTFDIPLPPTVLQGSETIVFDLSGGSDTVLIRTTRSGAGPRLLVIHSEQKRQ
ncbi:MAG: hypothetical protein HRU37_11910 [Roseibacillus sp.]|nr:hypothetical protein [Roseibacillus sp.]